MRALLMILFPYMIFARVLLFSDSNLNSRSAGLRNSDFAIPSYYANHFSNPALLAEQKSLYLSSTYYNYFADINSGNITLSNPDIIGSGVTAFSISSITYGEFNDIDTGIEYSPYDLMITISHGLMYEKILFGVNIKYIYSSITSEYNSSAFLTDFGTLYKVLGDKLSLGVGLFNAGIQLDEYYTTKEDIVSYIKAGLCYKLDKLPLKISSQYEYYFNEISRYAFGLELDAKKNLIIRAGYDFSGTDKEIGTNNKVEKFGGLSLGASVLVDPFGFDFSYMINGELDDEFCITLNLNMREFLK